MHDEPSPRIAVSDTGPWRIGIVQGGSEREQELSSLSAQAVADALCSRGHKVIGIRIDDLVSDILFDPPDVIFPAAHGGQGENGTLAGSLLLFGIPFVGSGVEASALAMNKSLSRMIFLAHGIDTPRGVTIHADDEVATAVSRIASKIGSNIVVKPAREGTSAGISFCNPSEIQQGIKFARYFDNTVVLEERIAGQKIAVAILEDPKARALPVLDIPSGPWFNSYPRFEICAIRHAILSKLSGSQKMRAQKIALVAHRALGCRDMSLSQFIVADDRIVIVGFDALPTMNPTSHFAIAAEAAGLTFKTFILSLVERAIRRGYDAR